MKYSNLVLLYLFFRSLSSIRLSIHSFTKIAHLNLIKSGAKFNAHPINVQNKTNEMKRKKTYWKKDKRKIKLSWFEFLSTRTHLNTTHSLWRANEWKISFVLNIQREHKKEDLNFYVLRVFFSSSPLILALSCCCFLSDFVRIIKPLSFPKRFELLEIHDKTTIHSARIGRLEWTWIHSHIHSAHTYISRWAYNMQTVTTHRYI